MPEIGLVLSNHDGTPRGESTVILGKAPRRGSWFDLGDGTAARCDDVRIVSGDVVVFASLDRPGGPPRLRSARGRQRGAARSRPRGAR